MATEERVDSIKELEDEFAEVKVELKQLLLDIRTCLMEGYTPLRSTSSGRGVPPQRDSEKR